MTGKIAFDAWLQEQKLEHEVALPPESAVKVPARIGPDPAALARAADMIAAAERPVIITEYTGRDHEAFHSLVELAEAGGIPVYDINARLSFPSRHPLNRRAVRRQAGALPLPRPHARFRSPSAA